MNELKMFFDLAQEYWVVTLVVTMIALSIFTKFRSGTANVNIKVSSSSLPNNKFRRGFDHPISSASIVFSSEDPLYEPVMKALDKRDKINAIKLIRQAKGLSLVEAKQFVEAIESTKNKPETLFQ